MSTFNLKRYEFPHVWVGEDRCYETDDGVFPGVTTVLSATQREPDRKRLEDWRVRYDAEHGEGAAEAYTVMCQERGTSMHGLIENRFAPGQLKPGELEKFENDDRAMPFWESMQPVLSRVDECILAEGVLWQKMKDGKGYAGSGDMLAIFDGELALLDWKSASKPKKKDWIKGYCMQVSAYLAAINKIYKADGVFVRKAVIAIALEGQSAQVFELEPVELVGNWRDFQKRLARYHKKFTGVVNDIDGPVKLNTKPVSTRKLKSKVIATPVTIPVALQAPQESKPTATKPRILVPRKKNLILS